jgi:hypothetical protein
MMFPSSSYKASLPRIAIAATRHGSHSFMMAMSLQSLPRASIALRNGSWRTAGVGRLTQQRWASDGKKGGEDEKPFYLQLQESIYERVQKEKAEQIRIQSLQGRTARGQFWATVTGTLRQNSGQYTERMY